MTWEDTINHSESARIFAAIKPFLADADEDTIKIVGILNDHLADLIETAKANTRVD